MNTSVKSYIKKLNPRKFTNNTQKALYRLLKGDGWVSRNSFRIPSVGSRIRDLRKNKFGSFDVVCQSAASLGRNGDSHMFYYRIGQRITLGQVKRVFED